MLIFYPLKGLLKNAFGILIKCAILIIYAELYDLYYIRDILSKYPQCIALLNDPGDQICLPNTNRVAFR